MEMTKNIHDAEAHTAEDNVFFSRVHGEIPHDDPWEDGEEVIGKDASC